MDQFTIDGKQAEEIMKSGERKNGTEMRRDSCQQPSGNYHLECDQRIVGVIHMCYSDEELSARYG